MSNRSRSGRMTRRDFMLASAALAGTAALAACATPGSDAGGAEGVATEAVTISFMGWGGPGEDQGVRAAIEVFEAEQSDVKVQWLHTPENYGEKFLANVAAGTPPDTAFIGSDVYRTYIRDELLMDITDNMEVDSLVGADDYFIQPQEAERCTKDGRWYGIGSCWVAPHFYYNADIFAAEGIDPPTNDPDEAWDWDKLLEVATALTVDVNGNHPGDSGFDIENVDRWGVHWPTWSTPLHAAIASNGGAWSDPETELLLLDQPEATEAIQRVADLMLVHQVMPQSSVFESLGMSNTQMLESGKMAMAVDGSWALDWMKEIDATLGTGCLAMMTEPATDMQAHLHSALAGTSEPEAAWEWVRFLSTPFYQTQFCRTGLWLPSQQGLMTEEGLTEWISEDVHPAGYEKIPLEYLPRYGHVLYQSPGWPKASSIITPALDAVWIGDATAEEAMVAAVPEANAILADELSKG